MDASHPSLDGPVAVASLLLFVQGAIAVALASEAVGAAIAFGGAPAPGAILTVAGAVATLVLAGRVRGHRRSTRRWILAFEIGWIVLAAVDLLLATFLADRGLTPVGFAVRMALPGAIIWSLRRPAAKVAFGIGEAADGQTEFPDRAQVPA